MANYVIALEEGEDLAFDVETLRDGIYRVTTPDGQTFEVDAYMPEDGRLHMLINGQATDADVRFDGMIARVDIQAERYDYEVLNARQQRMRAAGVGARGAGGPDLTSPMAGKVIAIQGEIGQHVEQGQPLVIVEAMKMENDLKAHISGTISAIEVEAGQAVEIGDVLLSIDAE